MHTIFVRQPEPQHLSPRVELDEKMQQFNGAIGAVDGTHIPAYIPQGRQTRFYNRKNNISQSIFAAVSFEGLFQYVLAGAEGSYHDGALILEARENGFTSPRGRFFVADSGFGFRPGILVPFSVYRYHLQDWREVRVKPACKEELYSFRHAQLRVIVEQAFGRWKRKFKIIRCSAAEYDIRVQVALVYALIALYNFIILEGKPPEMGYEDKEAILTVEERGKLESARRRADSVFEGCTPAETRDHIADWVWQDREEALELRNEDIDMGGVFLPLEELEIDEE